MIFLIDSTDSIVLNITSGGLIECHIQLNFVDLDNITKSQSPGRKNQIITSSGDTIINDLSDSNTDISRSIKSLSIYNASDITCDIEIKRISDGITSILFSKNLITKSSVHYTSDGFITI